MQGPKILMPRNNSSKKMLGSKNFKVKKNIKTIIIQNYFESKNLGPKTFGYIQKSQASKDFFFSMGPIRASKVNIYFKSTK